MAHTDNAEDMGHEHGNQEGGEDSISVADNINPNVNLSHMPGEGLNKTELAAVIAMQSILNQLSHPQVRGDFLSGKFHWRINPTLLSRIDQLRCVTFPRWLAGGLYVATERCGSAALHLKRLLAKENTKLILPAEDVRDSLTYREWYEVMEMVAADSYWDEMPPEDRCVHLFPTGATQASMQLPPEAVVKTEKNPLVEVKKRSTQPTIKSTAKVEEIVITDSDEVDRSSGEESLSQEEECSTQRYHLRRREVVKPPMYVLDGKEHLLDYLEVFEEYFKKRYDGSEKEMTQELSNFIDGQLLEVYTIKGGRKLRYPEMKKELLYWYKKQKIGGKSFWKKELEETGPAEDESYAMYGMRLIELVKLAYPASKIESAKHLRAKFLNPIDGAIAERISDAELAYRIDPKTKANYTPFSSIMEMANELQKSHRKVKTIMWTTSHQSKPDCASISTEQSRETRSRSFSRQRRGTSTGSRAQCHYCKRAGHIKAECWRIKKACLICGAGHAMQDCDKYNPNYKRTTTAQKYDQQYRSQVKLSTQPQLNTEALSKVGYP